MCSKRSILLEMIMQIIRYLPLVGVQEPWPNSSKDYSKLWLNLRQPLTVQNTIWCFKIWETLPKQLLLKSQTIRWTRTSTPSWSNRMLDCKGWTITKLIPFKIQGRTFQFKPEKTYRKTTILYLRRLPPKLKCFWKISKDLNLATDWKKRAPKRSQVMKDLKI